MYDKWLEEIKNRCEEQNINISDCYIMYARNEVWFNGEIVRGFTESQDGRWICIPVYDDENSNAYGDYVYSPQCFEIKEKMKTYLSDGYMHTLTTIWLLYK